MRLLFGGEFPPHKFIFFDSRLIYDCSITRTIGEAFKLHAQSLEDEDETGSMTSTSTTSTTPEACSPAANYNEMDTNDK